MAAVMFQSAPHDESRGDSHGSQLSGQDKKFQSAPHDESRGDRIAGSIVECGVCFNPRPMTSHGATPAIHERGADAEVSIRAP